MVPVAGAGMDSPVNSDHESDNESAASDDKYSSEPTELSPLPDELDDSDGNFACRFCLKRFTLVSASPACRAPSPSRPADVGPSQPVSCPGPKQTRPTFLLRSHCVSLPLGFVHVQCTTYPNPLRCCHAFLLAILYPDEGHLRLTW